MPSVMQRIGTPNARHNLDNAYRAHLVNVDPTLSQYNEVIRTRSLNEIYQEKLQPGFEAFNAKQTRKDRRLDVKWNCSTYLEYQYALDKKARESKNNIDRKGKPPIREIVWQFGNPEQGYGSKGQSKESRERIKLMLLKCQCKAEARYHQLAWGDLVFHADEVSADADDIEHGSIHLHSSFVPICYQNKQGPVAQVAFERCLHEMGFESFTAWKHDLDKIMEEVLREYGLERTYMDNQEKHQDSTQWHRQQAEIKRTKELEKEAARTKQRLDSIDLAIHKELENLDNRIHAFGANSIEETINNPDGIYTNILFLATNCDDDRFEELDHEGRELKEHMLQEALARAQNPLRIGLDETINNINSAIITWEERNRLWSIYNEASREFWEFRADFRRDLQLDLDAAYRKRRDIMRSYYDTLYFLRKTNSLIITLITAACLIYQINKQNALSNQIAELKRQQQQLALETSSFAQYSRTYRDDLKAGKVPGEKCLEHMTGIVRDLDCEYQRYKTQKNIKCNDSKSEYLCK